MTRPEGEIDLIQFDGGALVADMVGDFNAEDTGELTQHAIEDGSDIADHFIFRPRALTLTLVQTESPIETDVKGGFTPQTVNLEHATRPAGRQKVTVPIAQPVFRPTSLLALTGAVQSALFGGPPKTLTIEGLKADGAVSAKPFSVTALAANADKARINEFYDVLLSLFEGVVPLTVTVKGRSYPDMIITSVTRSDGPGTVGKANFTVSLSRLATTQTRTVELPPVPAATAKASRGGKSATDKATPRAKTAAAAVLDMFSGGD